MSEPITLALVGGAALTEGIKFLYNQAGEILKRLRQRKEKPSKENSQTEPVKIQLPEEFEGHWLNPELHFDEALKADEDLRELRAAMADYVDGVELVDPTNENLMKKVDVLRQLIEAVYQQHLTFKGEPRPPSGPVINAKIDVKEVLGYAAAIRAEGITSGQLNAEAKADSVGQGGELIGVDIKKIG